MTGTVNKLRAWKRLERHAKKMKKIEMRDMFEQDNKRASKFSLQLESMLVDFSKNRVNEKTLVYLLELARVRGVEEKIQAMFSGEKINFTENRAVLHTALRNRDNTPVYVDGKNVMPQINEVLAKMRKFSEAVRFGKFVGYTGKKLTDIVNIGIGGSDLGPCMITAALTPYHTRLKLHFVSNIDGTQIVETLKPLNPETTLFLIASKTFTTLETMTNANTVNMVLDPMLATGGSMELSYKALLTKGTPKSVHVASVIASRQAIDYVKQHFPDDTTLWVGAIDDQLDDHSYIVPGLGDAGDLAYGIKE